MTLTGAETMNDLWMETLGEGRVRIGLREDCCGPDLMITGLELPRPGVRLPRGAMLFRLRITTKVCTDQVCTYVPSVREFRSGSDFVVESVNSEASHDPALVQEDPRGQGWLLEGRPQE